MSDVTRILSQIDDGDPQAAEKLLPLVYDELRKLAAARLANEKPGQTLQATALVHEAYIRLVGPHQREGEAPAEPQAFDSRGHFFSAAAEAMRRILIENARKKARIKHGGGREREELEAIAVANGGGAEVEDLLVLDEALDRLASEDPAAAELVKLRYFAGLTIPQAAAALDVSPRKADFLWSFARAWLRREIEKE